MVARARPQRASTVNTSAGPVCTVPTKLAAAGDVCDAAFGCFARTAAAKLAAGFDVARDADILKQSAPFTAALIVEGWCTTNLAATQTRALTAGLSSDRAFKR